MFGIEKIYDLITDDIDYERQSETIARIAKNGSLLDLACGTGQHLQFLRRQFQVTGLDLNPSMLEIARRRLGNEIELIQGDMSSFNLQKKFNAITCIFGSIGYLDLDQFHEFFRCCFDHLEKDGVLILEPWISSELYSPAIVRRKYENYEVVSDNQKLGHWSIMHKTYTVEGEVYSRIENLYLHGENDYRTAMEEAGFSVELNNFSDGLFRKLWVGHAC